MGVHQSKADSATRQVGKSGSDAKAVRYVTAAAFRAVDLRNVSKLRKALADGAAVGNVQRVSNSDSSTAAQSRSMSLLEYAVDKNFLTGVDIMLKVRFKSFVYFRHTDVVRCERERSYLLPYFFVTQYRVGHTTEISHITYFGNI